MVFFGNSRLVLKKETDGIQRLVYLSPNGDLNSFVKNNYTAEGPFNNLGVPGSKVINSIAPGYGNRSRGEGNYNPFFFRMASDSENASLLSDAMKIKPTFFSLFIGNNDVLAYAISGGTSDTITPLVGPAGVGFEESLNFMINTLTASGAKGVICNLPGLNSIPLFNTIHYNGLLLDASNAKSLNEKYASFGIIFSSGHNAFLVEDISAINGVRQMEKEELVSLDILLDENKDNYLKGLKPIPKKYYLSRSQVAEVKSTLTAYNNCIKNIAGKKQLAFVDLNRLLETIKADRIYDNVNHTIKYKTRGVFALDGLHINSLGHALLANEFIKAINHSYGTSVHKVSLAKFRTNNKINTNEERIS